jgi:hypothetical protein
MTDTGTCPTEDCDQEVAPKPHGCLSYEDARAQEIERHVDRLARALVIIPILGCTFLSIAVLTVFIFFLPAKVESLVRKIPTIVLVLWLPLVIVYLTAMLHLLPRIARWRTDKTFPPR